jgi:PKD repeat protein
MNLNMTTPIFFLTVTRRCQFALLVTSVLLALNGARAATWAGFLDLSTNLLTQNISFTGTTNPAAGDSNENYYDGDMGDFDGDGWHDRALIARYGLLFNTGAGIMTPAANTIGGGTFRFGDKDGFGNDAAQWADVDNDGDYDILQGGNGEQFTLQINAGLGRFTTKPIPSVSALNIVNIDFDRDGDVDLAIAHSFCSDVQCGHGCPEVGCGPGIGNWPKQFNLFVNDGNGNFTNVTTSRGFINNFGTNLIMGVAAGDVDNDGDFDLLMINGIQRGITLGRNNGAGFFTTNLIPFAVAMAPIRPISSGFSQGMNLGDIDDDGDLDIVAALDRDTAGSPHPRVAHAVFINDGAGNFVEQTATRFTVAGTNFFAGGNGKLIDVDYDGDLDFFAFDFGANKHVQVYLNNGAGNFTYSTNDSRFFGGGASTGTGSDNDVTDLNRDGSYDVWIGAAGQNPRTLINTFQSPDGLPANMPRNLTVLAATNGGIALSWKHPAYADVARWYKVYRSTAPQLAATDRRVLKRVAISRHQDEGFAAPITRFTTTAYLNDPDVTLVGTNNEVQFIDRTAVPGITYYYSVSHVGTENIDGVPTAEVAAIIPSSGGPDTTAPMLTIVSPIQQDWWAYPRIVLDYADSGSGINASSLRVSMNRALGDPLAGGRVAGTDITDLFYRKDGNAYIAALAPPLALPNNTLVTLTASITDNAGNSRTQSVQFFVSVVAPQLPTAAIGNTATNGLVPLAIPLSGAGSTDSDGKILRWEWYFGDGTTALGRNVTKTYARGGTYNVTLLVRDTQGGVSTTSRSITVADFAILNAITAGTNFSLSFPTATNRNYTVERTASLNPTNWTAFTTVPGNGSVRTVINTNATNAQQFFRVRVD